MYSVLLFVALCAAPGNPPPPCEQVQSPFTSDGRSFARLNQRLRSPFGAPRTSTVTGHKHAGVDLTTAYGEAVRVVCAGRVEDIHLGFPHRTVVVSHRDPDGAVWYSSYKHVADVKVAVGDDLAAGTVVARVFNRDEQRSAGWRDNHLHFEVRFRVDDGGEASWTSMSLEALRRYARDPMPWLRSRLAK